MIHPRLTGPRRHRDGLDELIDEFFPDNAEGPSVTDAALIGGGGVLVGWAVLGSPPVAATVAGVVSLALGAILPVRAGWRWIAARRRALHRPGHPSRGFPLRLDDPVVARLVVGYEALHPLVATTDEARAAAHGAVIEVASLLSGRVPGSDNERRYVEARATAVEALVEALTGAEPVTDVVISPDLVVEAREELDRLGGASALSRVDGIAAELRARGRQR